MKAFSEDLQQLTIFSLNRGHFFFIASFMPTPYKGLNWKACNKTKVSKSMSVGDLSHMDPQP